MNSKLIGEIAFDANSLARFALIDGAPAAGHTTSMPWASGRPS